MEMIVFCGLQGSGKSHFYHATFSQTHLRINLDMLRTRRRESAILNACLSAGQRFVVDNTNPTITERAHYLTLARDKHFTCTGYFFDVDIETCLARNAQRDGRARIDEKGVFATKKKLETPSLEEGFDKIVRVDTFGETGLLTEPSP